MFATRYPMLFPAFVLKASYGPGAANPLKGLRYRVTGNERVTDRTGAVRRITTLTSVLSGTRPHQSDREINRRRRQSDLATAKDLATVIAYGRENLPEDHRLRDPKVILGDAKRAVRMSRELHQKAA